MASKQEDLQIGNESVYELVRRPLLRGIRLVSPDMFDSEVNDGLLLRVLSVGLQLLLDLWEQVISDASVVAFHCSVVPWQAAY